MIGTSRGDASVDLAVRTEHLTKVYAGRVIAVNDMTLHVPAGSIYGLLGPNGAGKTTTLRLLLGLQRPTAGYAEIFGHRCGVSSTAARQAIGYLPTNPKLPGQLRPVEYLDLLGKLCRIPREQRQPRLTSLLRAVGLLGATDQRIQTFSTGMCTRLGIAASLLADPPLLLWDEPTAGLDPAARRFTLDLIRELGQTRTVIIATHILSDIDQICDHVGVMHEGRMVFSGPMREMKRRLQRDDFLLEVDGAADSVRGFVQQFDHRTGLQLAIRDEHTLVVEIDPGGDRAAELAALLQAMSGHGLKLVSIRSSQNETEHAYLQLLHEDSAHGFRRFDIPARPAADAADRNPAV